VKETLPESKWNWLRVAYSTLTNDQKIAIYSLVAVAITVGMLLLVLGGK
jgi:hypothetical protein